MNPKFSVIVPAYNSEEYIGRGLASVRNQSFQDFELIVVCDSCRDQTESVARSFGAITQRVEFGTDGLTRDRGIEMAQGEWVLFMDDDDWYLHEYCFQQLADVVGRHDEDVLCYSYIWRTRGYISATDNSSGWSHVWSRCWRREAIGDARFGNAPFASDTYFVRRMKDRARRVAVWDMPMYYYNFMRKGSQSDLLAGGKIYSRPHPNVKE